DHGGPARRRRDHGAGASAAGGAAPPGARTPEQGGRGAAGTRPHGDGGRLVRDGPLLGGHLRPGWPRLSAAGHLAEPPALVREPPISRGRPPPSVGRRSDLGGPPRPLTLAHVSAANYLRDDHSGGPPERPRCPRWRRPGDGRRDRHEVERPESPRAARREPPRGLRRGGRRRLHVVREVRGETGAFPG